MKGLLSRRPSPALVVAVVALVVAMAGTGYAAFKLPKNSVGTKQIKKNAVNGAKVKNKSLTGKDINLEKLGTVPSANVANGLAAMEATHFVGTAGQPPFESGSTNTPGELGLNFPHVGFYKDHDGIVHLTGLAKVGEGGISIFQLPAGFRPAAGTVVIVNVFCFGETGSCEKDSGSDEQIYTRLLIAGSGTSIEGFTLDGKVLARPGTSVSLDGVSFRAES